MGAINRTRSLDIRMAFHEREKVSEETTFTPFEMFDVETAEHRA